MQIVSFRITRSSMVPVVWLLVAVFVAVVDLGAGRNPIFMGDLNPRDSSVKKVAGLADEGSRGENTAEFRQPSEESVIKYLTVTPSSVVRDVRHGTDRYELPPTFPPSPSNRSNAEGTPEEQLLKPSSHLRLQKTGDNRIVIQGDRGAKSKSRVARNAVGFPDTFDDAVQGRGPWERGGRRHRFQRYLYDMNYKNDRYFASNTRDHQMFKYYPERLMDDAGYKYYYNEYNMDEPPQRADEGWPPLPDSLATRGAHYTRNQLPRRFQADSCKKYLEFLKYAFEQLESPAKKINADDQDEYIYYDDDYNKPDPKVLLNGYAMRPSPTQPPPPPPVIEPDMSILHRLAVTSFSNSSHVEKNFPVVGMERRSSDLPPKTMQNVTPGSRSPLSFDVLATRNDTELVSESRKHNITKPGKHTGILRSESQTKKKKEKSTSGDCHDKLFPCPDNVNVTYPVNGYCNRFVACEGGKPHPEFCQEGLHFNLVEKQCDLPHNSFCTYSCPTADGYFAVPGDCGGFFRCSNWYPEYRLCPPKMHWNKKDKMCTFEELSSCPLKCESPYQIKPYTGVCNAYIICTRNIPKYHQCPSGYHFDANHSRCVSKLLSNCTNDENYIARNRGIENGKKAFCADVELVGGGKTRWCQETFEEPKT